MRVETRKTMSGTEYWDTKEKRSIFVPNGQTPDFEVAVDPVSMIANGPALSPEEMKKINKIMAAANPEIKADFISADFGSGKNITVDAAGNTVEDVAGAGAKDPGEKVTEDDSSWDEGDAPGYVDEDGEFIKFDDMTIKELRKYAATHNIVIPKEAVRKDEIIAVLAAAEDDE